MRADIAQIVGRLVAAAEQLAKTAKAGVDGIADAVQDDRIRKHQMDHADVDVVAEHLVDQEWRLAPAGGALPGEIAVRERAEKRRIVVRRRFGGVGKPVGDGAPDRRAFAEPGNLAVAGQDLLDQRRARARHAQDEDRRGAAVALAGMARKELRREDAFLLGDNIGMAVRHRVGMIGFRPRTWWRNLDDRGLVDGLHEIGAAQAVGFEKGREGLVILPRGFEGLAEGKQHPDPRSNRRFSIPCRGGQFGILRWCRGRGPQSRNPDQRAQAHWRQFGEFAVQRNRLVELAEDFQRMGQREARRCAVRPDRPGAPVGVGGLLPLAQFLERIGERKHALERAWILAGDKTQVFERALEIAGFDIHQRQEIRRRQHIRVARPNVLIVSRGFVETALAMELGRAFKKLCQGFRIQRRRFLWISLGSGHLRSFVLFRHRHARPDAPDVPMMS